MLVLLQQTTHRQYHEKNCLHLGNFCCDTQNDSFSSVFLRVELWWRSWTDVGIKFLSNVFPFPGLPLILCFSTGKTLLFFAFCTTNTPPCRLESPPEVSPKRKKQKTYVSVEVTPMTQINTRTDPKSKEADDLQQHISHSYFFFPLFHIKLHIFFYYFYIFMIIIIVLMCALSCFFFTTVCNTHSTFTAYIHTHTHLHSTDKQN